MKGICLRKGTEDRKGIFMKKRIFVGILILVSLFFTSCKYILASTDYYVETLEFKSGKYTLYVGEAEVCYVSVSPSDSFEWYETEYSVDDTEVVSFEGSTDSYCIIKALKEGTTIISATLGGKTAKAVVTVKSEDS